MLRVMPAGLLLVVATMAPSALAQDAADGAATETPATEDAAAADAPQVFERVTERSPRDGTPIIANKLYPMAFRFEFGGDFDISYGDKFVEHTGGSGRIGFHVFDWLAIEGFGGYLAGNESSIATFVRQRGYSFDLSQDDRSQCFSVECEPQLPDLWQTTWFAGANVQWAPIYGKISAVSEYDLNFQLYARLGGGVEGITKKLNDGGFAEAAIRPTLNYGIGVRLIPWKYIALRAELVNYTGINPNVEEHDADDEGDCGDGYVIINGVSGTEECYTDFTTNAMVQLGISIML
jgi:outer membrane beta-barrel protein